MVVAAVEVLFAVLSRFATLFVVAPDGFVFHIAKKIITKKTAKIDVIARIAVSFDDRDQADGERQKQQTMHVGPVIPSAVSLE